MAPDGDLDGNRSPIVPVNKHLEADLVAKNGPRRIDAPWKRHLHAISGSRLPALDEHVAGLLADLINKAMEEVPTR